MNLNNSYELIQYELEQIEITKPFKDWLTEFLKDEHGIDGIYVGAPVLSPKWFTVEIECLSINASTMNKIMTLVGDWISFSTFYGKDKHSTGIHFPIHEYTIQKLLTPEWGKQIDRTYTTAPERDVFE